MPDAREELRNVIAHALYPTYGQEDGGRSLAIADKVLSVFTHIRRAQRDIDVTTLGQSHEQIHREHYLVAELFVRSEQVQGERLGMYFTESDGEPGDDDLHPGVETGSRDDA